LQDFFAAVSDSSLATCATVGKMTLPQLLMGIKAQYSQTTLLNLTKRKQSAIVYWTKRRDK
jgi:TRAP-type C4-dicarboxylate transport system permease large subunit